MFRRIASTFAFRPFSALYLALQHCERILSALDGLVALCGVAERGIGTEFSSDAPQRMVAAGQEKKAVRKRVTKRGAPALPSLRNHAPQGVLHKGRCLAQQLAVEAQRHLLFFIRCSEARES